MLCNFGKTTMRYGLLAVRLNTIYAISVGKSDTFVVAKFPPFRGHVLAIGWRLRNGQTGHCSILIKMHGKVSQISPDRWLTDVPN